MKKRVTYILLMVMTLCTSKVAFAQEQVPETSAATTPAVTATPAVPAKPDITSDPLYNTLLTKNGIKNNLITKENQVCKQIREQENANKVKAAAIIDRSNSYSVAYSKVIDDIKLLLSPIREKETLYYKEISKNSSDSVDTAELSGTEASIFDNTISNLNLAVKAMRESMKYISLESANYNLKLQTVQNNIDSINLSIEELSKQITKDKGDKDIEWNNFCSAMTKNDLKAANQSFDNMIKLKEHIIENYNNILQSKKSIGEELASIETNK